MASSDRAARRKTTGIQQLCQSVRSLQGEKSVGGNPDTEVTGWENPGSGELQNSVSYTSWDDQEFSVVSREVNFLSGISSGIKVACWITQEFSNLRKCCAHSLEESGSQWHGMGVVQVCLSFPLLFSSIRRYVFGV